jgi:hypothetical protein
MSQHDLALLLLEFYRMTFNRTRSIVDQFGEAGYFALAPKLLVPAFEGGTQGEGMHILVSNFCIGDSRIDTGLPPDFDFSTRGRDFIGYAATFTWGKLIWCRHCCDVNC